MLGLLKIINSIVVVMLPVVLSLTKEALNLSSLYTAIFDSIVYFLLGFLFACGLQTRLLSAEKYFF